MNIELTINQLLDTTFKALFGKTAQEARVKWSLTKEKNTSCLHISMGIPSLSMKEQLTHTLKAALQEIFPQESIEITIDHFIKSHKTQMPGKGLRGVKNTIAIASGKGGVGKSTVTVNLGIALANAGARVGILDADIYGPSIPLMLGKTPPIQIKDERYVPALKHGIQAMSIGYLMQSEQPLIWRGPMLAKSLIQMLDMTLWDDLDYLLIDLPPGTGDIQLSLVQKIPLTGAVVVTTPQQVATLDAQKAIQMFTTTHIDVLGLVENMSLHTCSHCNHQEAIFEGAGARALCEQYQCQLLGELPLDRRISIECDEGIPTSSREPSELKDLFTKIALNMAIELSKKELNYADKFPPIVVE